ncbi:hypothetical protein [Streptomyces sp. NPDC048650]|uniref:hypothetical protein n=1 Tax=unclassified Streptomyces TaxID=2593676 RepID=UPI00371CAC61
MPDQAAGLAEMLRRPVGTVEVPPKTARRQRLAAGPDPSVVEVALRGDRLVRAGGNAVLTEDVTRALGRPARTVRNWARDHREAFLRP